MFASADGANMQKLVTGGQVTAEPTVFAVERAHHRGEAGQPEASVKSLADLANLDVVSLCARRRCRAASTPTQILTGAGVTIPPRRSPWAPT